jgi:hypothetical protein
MSRPLLEREEYIEQAYFFRVLRERLGQYSPMQEILAAVREEILSTTKLPMAIDFLIGELQLKGRLSGGMARLSHYFAPFQTYIVDRAEDDTSRLDFGIALHILEREAEFLSQSQHPDPAALFIYQFECLARNRLGYDTGMVAIAADPMYDDDWKNWINRCRFELGTSDFADLIYARSEFNIQELRRKKGDPGYLPPQPPLFSHQAGRIARANRGKEPLYMFAALQRQLGYPAVPRPQPSVKTSLSPELELRLQRLEGRLSLVEQEQKGELDLSKFYQPRQNPGDD